MNCKEMKKYMKCNRRGRGNKGNECRKKISQIRKRTKIIIKGYSLF